MMEKLVESGKIQTTEIYILNTHCSVQLVWFLLQKWLCSFPKKSHSESDLNNNYTTYFLVNIYKLNITKDMYNKTVTANLYLDLSTIIIKCLSNFSLPRLLQLTVKRAFKYNLKTKRVD